MPELAGKQEDLMLRGKPLSAFSQSSRSHKRRGLSRMSAVDRSDDDSDDDLGLGRRKRTRLGSSHTSLMSGSASSLRSSNSGNRRRRQERMSLPVRLSSSRVKYSEVRLDYENDDEEDSHIDVDNEGDFVDVQAPIAQTPLKRKSSNARLKKNADPAIISAPAAIDDSNDNNSGTAREERPFTDFFPDLSTSVQLPLVKYNPTPSASRDGDDLNMDDDHASGKHNSLVASSSSSSVLFNKLSSLVYTFVERVSSPMSGSATVSHSQTPAEKVADATSMDVSDNEDDDDKNDNGDLPRFVELEPPFHGPVLHPKYPETIPVCSFEKIDPSSADRLLASTVKFDRSERIFVRYAQPAEEELESRVEYDLDEQDICWLDSVNRQRLEIELAPIPYNFLEKVIDMLEKEWFSLTKDIAKHSEEPLSHEDSLCNICGDSEVDNSNAIVFCDGCNLAVHQECYGVPYIPEGQWLCRKCMVAPEKPVSCIFCPHKDGAFKQTTTNKWAHLLCVLWIPEVYVSNPVYMEPVEGVDKIPKSRWKLVCSICKQKGGACIQCCKSTCFTAYHVTCARKAGYYMKSKNIVSGGEQAITYKSFCLKHEPVGSRPSLMGTGDGTDSEVDIVKMPVAVAEKNAKRKKKKASIISLNSPVIPHVVLQDIIRRLDRERTDIRKRNKFVIDVCKYWSLKRRQRRGAPLLKRLHLEPWTANSTHIKQSEEIQIQRVKILNFLREDLETTRTLSDLCLRRERKKLQSVKNYISLLQLTLSPLTHILQKLLDDLKGTDKYQVFWYPVSAKDVPDYYDIVKNPMCFETIQTKIHEYEYDALGEFRDDVILLISNALLYNKRESFVAKLAMKLQQKLEILMEQADSCYASLPIDGNSHCLVGDLPTPYAGYYGDSYKFMSPKIEEIVEVEEEASSRSVTPILPNAKTEAKPKQAQKSVKKSKFPKIDSELASSVAEYIRHAGAKSMYWCKTDGFPWFPAELIDKPNKEDEVPEGMLDLSRKGAGKVFRFLDRDLLTKRTWTYLDKQRFVICDFGRTDADMLKACIKKVKSPIIKKQALIGYLAGLLARDKDPVAIFGSAGVDIDPADFKMLK